MARTTWTQLSTCEFWGNRFPRFVLKVKSTFKIHSVSLSQFYITFTYTLFDKRKEKIRETMIQKKHYFSLYSYYFLISYQNHLLTHFKPLCRGPDPSGLDPLLSSLQTL